jgi:hypothetical protein
MKQTVVDFLIENLHLHNDVYFVTKDKRKIIQLAREMHKEQILTTWSVATNPDYEIGFGDMFYILEQEKKAEKYYNETFNTKEK